MNTSLLDNFPSEKLSPVTEGLLAVQIKGGSEGALTALVLANMREALLYTGRVCDGRLDEATRISLCYQEMCMSARRFIPGRLRFFAFAKAGLRGRMKTHWKSLRVVRNAAPTVSLESLETAGPHRVEPTPHHSDDEARTSDDDHERSPREEITGEIDEPKLDPLFAKDQWLAIRRALADALSEQQWMVLDLTYLSGLNFPQIGKLFGLTRSAIHRTHRNAIRKLRCALAENPRLLYGENTRS